MPKWTRGQVTLSWANGERPVVPAHIFGNWAVHAHHWSDKVKEWRVSHALSGYGAGRAGFAKLRDAKAYAERLAEIWDGDTSGMADPNKPTLMELPEEKREAIKRLYWENR